MRIFDNHKFGLVQTPPERLAKVPHIMSFFGAAGGALPLIADETNYSLKCPSGLWGMFGNGPDPTDPEVGAGCGNCVLAYLANAISTHAVNSGQPVPGFTSKQVVGWYSEVTGYVPGDESTDNGTDPVDMLNWALGKNLILGYGQVPIVGNDAHLACAIDVFGGVGAAVQVPSGWMDSTTWDANMGTIEGGHMIGLVNHDQNVNTGAETWGQIVRVTKAGKDQYGVAAYAIITPQWMQTIGTTLQGFKLEELRAALSLVK